MIADFAPGATESLVLYAAQSNPDLIVVEGQGAINHPAYAPVTLALMYGAAPDALVLVCDPVRERIGGYDTPTLGYRELIRLHEALLATVKPARVVGIALNTRGLDDAGAHAQIERARRETSLPADDVVRNGPDALFAAIAPEMRKGATVHRLIAFVMLALLCACSRPSSIPGVLRLGEQNEPDSLNLMFAHSAATDEIDALLFTHLFRFDANGNMIPGSRARACRRRATAASAPTAARSRCTCAMASPGRMAHRSPRRIGSSPITRCSIRITIRSRTTAGTQLHRPRRRIRTR